MADIQIPQSWWARPLEVVSADPAVSAYSESSSAYDAVSANGEDSEVLRLSEMASKIVGRAAS